MRERQHLWTPRRAFKRRLSRHQPHPIYVERDIGCPMAIANELQLYTVPDLAVRHFDIQLDADMTQRQRLIFRYLARLMLVIPDATIAPTGDPS